MIQPRENTTTIKKIRKSHEGFTIITAESRTAPSANVNFGTLVFHAGGEVFPANQPSEMTTLVSEAALARIWDTPAEDEAWQGL